MRMSWLICSMSFVGINFIHPYCGDVQEQPTNTYQIRNFVALCSRCHDERL
jgi:hypothetical protein